MAKPAEIRFYRANEKPYGAFSNLYRREVRLDGQAFPTAEHAYQAAKARRREVRDWILAAPSPALLAMAAHGLYQWDIVPEWSRIKFERMRAVRPDVPVLYVSGNADLTLVGRSDVVVDPATFLQKPFTANQLLSQVRRVIDAPRRPAPRG